MNFGLWVALGNSEQNLVNCGDHECIWARWERDASLAFAPTGLKKVLVRRMTRELERHLSSANRLPSNFDVADNRA